MGPGCFHPRNAAEESQRFRLLVFLQWGRDVSIPEITCPRILPSLHVSFNGAGMFPSQKCYPRSARRVHFLPSMGPGCFHPRNYDASVNLVTATDLQWGRDVSIPEIRTRLTGRSSTYCLQWGRDVS